MIPTPDRADPPWVADERTMLEAWLDYHRATLISKCAGLTDDELRERAVPPSSLSLLGLIRHMTEVERGWFSGTFPGVDPPLTYCSETNRDGDFDDIDEQDPAEALSMWEAECDKSRAVTAMAGSLDERSKRVDEDPSLRWIMIHMIEEYARHNGHADFLRERIDGATGS